MDKRMDAVEAKLDVLSGTIGILYEQIERLQRQAGTTYSMPTLNHTTRIDLLAVDAHTGAPRVIMGVPHLSPRLPITPSGMYSVAKLYFTGDTLTNVVPVAS